MKILFTFFSCLMSWAVFGQNKSVNYDNIFATSYTYVGVPHEDSLYIFGLEDRQWRQMYSFEIPDSTVAMDGNERRVFFLTKKEMIVRDYYNCGDICEIDTLRLSDVKGKILSENWLRAISSSESDFTVFNFSALQYYYKDGDSWHTHIYSNPFEKTEKKDPKFYIDMPYQKIMSFNNDMYIVTKEGQQLKFWTFDIENMLEKIPQLKKEFVPTEKLNIKLPKDVLSFFVYDGSKLGWVYSDHIEFHRFNKQKQIWEKASTPDLEFRD